MASLSHRNDRGRGGWVLSFYTSDKRKRAIWLGEVSKRTANNVKRHVEELVHAQKVNGRPEPDTERWVAVLAGRLRDSLAKYGLCDPADERLNQDACRLLGPFMEAYVESRTDAKPNTISNFNQAIDWTNKHFGRDRVLSSITPYDIEKLFRFLKKELAESTAIKHMKRLRTMLRAAVRDRLLLESPVVGLKLGEEVNRERDFYVDEESSQAIIETCPSIDWKLIFALPRYAGLRCPSEVHSLKWTDVDWDKGRLRIDSVKTGLRFCPIFEPLGDLLAQAWDEAPDGALFVVRHLRDAGKNLRTQLHRIIELAGLKPWPKTFVNLRATRRTELERLFPSHVVNTWLGHSAKIAEKHYLQVTEDDWQKALNLPGASTGASISARQELAGVGSGEENPRKSKAQTTRDDSRQVDQHPRQDSNLRPTD